MTFSSGLKNKNKLLELGFYLVKKYNMNPRDAVGIVMQSSILEKISEPNSEMVDWSIEDLAESIG